MFDNLTPATFALLSTLLALVLVGMLVAKLLCATERKAPLSRDEPLAREPAPHRLDELASHIATVPPAPELVAAIPVLHDDRDTLDEVTLVSAPWWPFSDAPPVPEAEDLPEAS